MNRPYHIHILNGGEGGLHIRDKMGFVRRVGFGEMHFVTHPGLSPFGAIAGVSILGGSNHNSGGCRLPILTPFHLIRFILIELLHPNLA